MLSKWRSFLLDLICVSFTHFKWCCFYIHTLTRPKDSSAHLSVYCLLKKMSLAFLDCYFLFLFSLPCLCYIGAQTGKPFTAGARPYFTGRNWWRTNSLFCKDSTMKREEASWKAWEEMQRTGMFDWNICLEIKVHLNTSACHYFLFACMRHTHTHTFFCTLGKNMLITIK